jgi:flagellar biosynthesis/type III secretory pathway M-ring protein FliF/YscJ
MFVQKLKHLITDIQKMIGDFTLVQKISFLLGALMVAFSLSCLVGFATAGDLEILLKLDQINVEEQQALFQSLDEQKVNWELKGDKVMIEKGRRQEVIMKLQLNKDLPAGNDHFYWIFNTGPGNTPTPKNFDERVRLSRGRVLAGLIASMPGVKKASVTISDGDSRNYFEKRRYPEKASVYMLTDHQSIGVEEVRALKAMVAHAVPKLEAKNVVVIKDGRLAEDKESFEAKDEADLWTAREIRKSRYLEQKLIRYFKGDGFKKGLVKNFITSISMTMKRERINETEIIKQELYLSKEEKESVLINGPSYLPEVGVTNATSVTVSTGLGGEGDFRHEEKSERNNFEPGHEKRISRELGVGEDKKISVAMAFDEDELLDSGLLDFEKNLSSETLIEKRINEYKEQAASALGIELSMISARAMKFASNEIPVKRGLQTVLFDFLADSGSHFLIFGLTLFGFLYFINVLRQAFETPELEGERYEEEKVRKSNEEDMAQLLDAEEDNADDVRARQVESRVKRFVKKHPQSTGKLIKRWLLQDSDDD